MGCWIAGVTSLAGVMVFVYLFAILYAMALSAATSPEAAPRKRNTRPSYAQDDRLLSQDDGGLLTVQGTPFPPLPEEVVRGSIILYGRMLQPLRRFGDTPALGRGYAFLATLHAAVDEVEESERLFREALRILKHHQGRPIDLTWVHNNHGLVQLNRGEFTEALHSFRTATLSKPSPEWSVVPLQNMGHTYFALGDLAQAEQAYLEALDVARAARTKGTFAHQVSRANLAGFYEQIGDLESARTLQETLLAEPGLDRATRVQVLNNLGWLYSVRRKFARAEACFVEAESLLSKRNRWRAAILANRATMHYRAGQFERAATVGEQARRAIAAGYGQSSPEVAAVLTELAMVAMRRGEVVKAEQLVAHASTIFEKQANKDYLVASSRVEALVADRLGERERAHALSRRALVLAKAHLDQILAFGSETQRLAYLSHAAPFDQLANMGEPNLLADAVLTMKGAVLESLLAERSLARSSTPAEQERLDRINQARVAIMGKIARGEDTEMLERDLKREQTSLASRRQRPRGTVDVRSVQAKLAPDQVLVEIVQYQRYAANSDVVAYGGVVIPHTGRPVWVPLGDGAAIEDRIASVVERYGGGRGQEPIYPDGDVATILRDLHDSVWTPLAKAFPAHAKRVLLSPDGATCFLPWAVLLDQQGRFLAERWEVTQIGSGRDLLRAPRAPSANTLLALGDGGNDLDHSRGEIATIESTARRHGWTVTALLGDQASECDLMHHQRPGVLHLATHAGRLQRGLDRAVQTRLSRNPMYRGYILLGGGRRTLAAWARGSIIPFTSDDGILTAEEASTLDLGDTWLTVLAACQSGAGDVRAGEGVMGLRRGFVLAGTENLLLSLWSVDDDSGAAFMKAFYGRVFSTTDPAKAFHQTQRAELARWRQQSKSVEGAVRHAGGFVMSR